MAVIQIQKWPGPAIDGLINEGLAEGFRFPARLRDEWHDGTNRFAGPGEAFFGVIRDDQLVAVGGINRTSAQSGRLRRCYVVKRERRKGIGRLLVGHVLDFAARHYAEVVTHTDTEPAARFYLGLGFKPSPALGESTYLIELTPCPI